MITRRSTPINTLDQAFRLARVLSHDLESEESKASGNLKIFSALASSEREALVAFSIWRARGEAFRDLIYRR